MLGRGSAGGRERPGHEEREKSAMQNGRPLLATEIPGEQGSPYPEPFASLATSTAFRRLADRFGLTQLGVNMVTLEPGTQSGLRHWHSLEDEFIYVIEGELTLRTNSGECRLAKGMCIGFKAQDRNAHLVLNRSGAVAHYLVVGSRVPGDVSFIRMTIWPGPPKMGIGPSTGMAGPIRLQASEADVLSTGRRGARLAPLWRSWRNDAVL